MDSILTLLDNLEEILDTSRAVPFSNKISVEKEKIYEIITDIRLKLPNEIKQSQWIMQERSKILVDAQTEADEIINNANERVDKLVDENEITKKAYEQAAIIIENSKNSSKEMRLGAIEYADGILAQTEAKVKEIIEAVHKNQSEMDEFFNETLEVLYENRQELRAGSK